MSASLDAMTAPPSATSIDRRRPIAPWEIAVVVGAVLTVALIGALALSNGAPLLWDESVYGLRTRFNLGLGEAVSTRGDYWLDVRAPGLPLLLTPTAAIFGSNDLALRITCLLFAMVATALTWYIARLLTDATTAAIAVWLVVIFPGWHVSSWQMMPDIPGAAITLAAMAIILAAGRGDRLSWWALLAVPLAGLATLVRYGAPLLIAPTVCAALLLRWRAAREAPVVALGTLVGSAVAAGVIWFVPEITGARKPPVFAYMGRQDGKAVPALESAADFFHRLGQLVGPVLGPVLVLGIVLAIIAAVRHRALRPPVLASGLIALILLLTMLFGIAVYQLRYLAPAVPFLAILAAIGLATYGARLAPRTLLVAAVSIAVLGTGVAGWTLLTSDRMRDDAWARDARQAYREVDAQVDGPCMVVARTAAAPWYTDCALLRFTNVKRSLRKMRRNGIAEDEPLYIVLRDGRSPIGIDAKNPGLEYGTVEQGDWLRGFADRQIQVTPRATLLDMGPVGEFTDALQERRPPGS